MEGASGNGARYLGDVSSIRLCPESQTWLLMEFFTDSSPACSGACRVWPTGLRLEQKQPQVILWLVLLLLQLPLRSVRQSTGTGTTKDRQRGGGRNMVTLALECGVCVPPSPCTSICGTPYQVPCGRSRRCQSTSGSASPRSRGGRQ